MNVYLLDPSTREFSLFFLKHFADASSAASAARIDLKDVVTNAAANENVVRTEKNQQIKHLIFKSGPRSSPPLPEVENHVILALKEKVLINARHEQRNQDYVPFKSIECLSLDGTFLRRFPCKMLASAALRPNGIEGISIAAIEYAASAADSRMGGNNNWHTLLTHPIHVSFLLTTHNLLTHEITNTPYYTQVFVGSTTKAM